MASQRLTPELIKNQCFEGANLARRLCSDNQSLSKLPHIVSQAIFHIARFVKAQLHQFFNPLLSRWSCDRSKARIPPSCDFDIRRQTSGVDKALRINDRPLVERGNPGRKRIDKAIKVSVRQRAVYISIEFSQVASNVVRA